MRERSNNFHLFIYKSSSPMDVDFNGDRLKFVTISGIFHWKLFLGNKDPESAVVEYHNYLGGYALHPFWASGFHQSRWGYKSAAVLIDVIRNHKENDIPLDGSNIITLSNFIVIWSDLDYMFDR
jgi:alpha-glucosidase/lysosomal alpha-glucosidase